MKKAIVFILSLLLSHLAFSQTALIKTFYLNYANREYGMYLTTNTADTRHFYIDFDDADYDEYAKMKLNKSELTSFIASLKKVKETYAKWCIIAKSHNVSLIYKRIPQSFSDEDFYFTNNGQWYSESGVDIAAYFNVDINGECTLHIQSDVMNDGDVVSQASSLGINISPNGFISFGRESSDIIAHKHSDGARLVFKDAEEIDTFINCAEHIITVAEKSIADSALFK